MLSVNDREKEKLYAELGSKDKKKTLSQLLFKKWVKK